jgi:redox-sensitive bicupin YhaK (pirin superfamily)
MNTAFRAIEKIFKPSVVPEGVGAKVRRIIGSQEVKKLDPFLMLDHFNAKLPAGFPDHPHRGFETVTYMLKGKFHHEDFKGHKGTIAPGDVQWMTAGKGIVHAEMPDSFDEPGDGFQLWINLPKKDKLCEPQYQEFEAKEFPIVTKEGFSVKVISGESQGTKGPIFHRTPTYYLDFTMNKKANLEQTIPKNWNGFVYVYSGAIKLGPKKDSLAEGQVAILKNEEADTLNILTEDSESKFIVIAGEPLNQEVA